MSSFSCFPLKQIPAALALYSAVFATGAIANTPQIFGLHEKVSLQELDVELAAKLDTGAETASLSATNIEIFNRNGDEWVRFQLDLEHVQHARVIEKPLARISYIKRRAGDRQPGDQQLYTERPVVEMDLCVGDELKKIEVNLTDRSAFDYPLLIGSTALKEFNAAVSPSVRFTAGQPSCTQTS